jgi:hypothetical protein
MHCAHSFRDIGSICAFRGQAQVSSATLLDRDQALFGFFQTEHLKPLSLMEATELLGNIARPARRRGTSRLLSTEQGTCPRQDFAPSLGGQPTYLLVLSNFILARQS